jgi:D-alanyl-D-alanine carboxypeptidase
LIENGVCISGSIFPFLLERNGVNDDSHIVPVSEEWNLIVVNHWNEIPEDYSVTLTELSNGQKVDSWIYPYLQEMFDAMRAEGIYPIVREAYRTADEQQEILDESYRF